LLLPISIKTTMLTSSATTTTTAANLNNLVARASSWCASFGILMGARQLDHTRQPLGDLLLEPAPFSLFPTDFPRTSFEVAYEMGKPFNALVHDVCSQQEWLLEEAIVTAAQGDPDFTGRLVSLAKEVEAKGKIQNLVLGVLRSDYMLHKPDGSVEDASLLQVELNTIASSFGCLSSKVSKMHKALHGESEKDSTLPPNQADEGIAKGIAMAYQAYQKQFPDSKNVAVVMVVQPGETNSIDQRDLEFVLKTKYGVPLVRKTLAELSQCQCRTDNPELLLDPDSDLVAGVVYYRAGYTPDDYPTEKEWKGRGLVEHSAAIKCPDVFYHLFGAKKVQQELTKPGILTRFSTDATLLESCFAKLYALGEDNDQAVIDMALKDPHLFVLKPQREGGGNNLYDNDLVHALRTMTKEERGGYIVMQKIQPPSTSGVLIRRGEIAYEGDVVCELGVFGISLRDYSSSKNILMDEVVGHILRTKSVKTDEGGVAAGYAFLSSPKLV